MRQPLAMDYRNFNVEDFASDDRFITWVNNDSSEEEKEFWSLLMLSNPELGEIIDRARALVSNVNRAENSLYPVDSATVLKIWDNIESRISDPSPNNQRTYGVFTFALSISAITFISAYFLIIKHTSPDEAWYSYSNEVPEFVEHINSGEALMRVQMPDGSVISLEQDSRIKYKKSYAADSIRAVLLMGEAFFDVVRDPKRQFVVLTRDVATKVLGTSFRVKADKDGEKIIVAVKTGRVSVYSVEHFQGDSRNPKEGVVLLPNQEVVYTRKEKLFEKKIVDIPKVIVSPQSVESFAFKNAPVDSVFAKLHEAYGIEIVFDREAIKNCFITAPFGSEPLFEKVKVICETIGASYEIIDAKVVITSAGCETYNTSD